MNEVMIKEYLELLGCPDAVKPCRENLFRIQQSHLEKIAYSNLPIFVSGYTPTLDIESLFNRIVRLRRGGYCFELNGLLAELLRSLGYGVTEFFARWHSGESAAIPMRRHRVLKVLCQDGTFLVDAGIGDVGPVTPLEYLPGVLQERGFRSYILEKDDLLGMTFAVEAPEGRSITYSFTEDPHYPQDFEYANYFCSASLTSRFRQKLIIHRQSADTQYFIAESDGIDPRRKFCIREKGVLSSISIDSKEMMQQILEDSFYLHYNVEEMPEIK